MDIRTLHPDDRAIIVAALLRHGLTTNVGADRAVELANLIERGE